MSEYHEVKMILATAPKTKGTVPVVPKEVWEAFEKLFQLVLKLNPDRVNTSPLTEVEKQDVKGVSSSYMARLLIVLQRAITRLENRQVHDLDYFETKQEKMWQALVKKVRTLHTNLCRRVEMTQTLKVLELLEVQMAKLCQMHRKETTNPSLALKKMVKSKKAKLSPEFKALRNKVDPMMRSMSHLVVGNTAREQLESIRYWIQTYRAIFDEDKETEFYSGAGKQQSFYEAFNSGRTAIGA